MGDRVNVIALDPDGNPTHRRIDNLTIAVHDMAEGSVAAYYPEANVLIPRWTATTRKAVFLPIKAPR
ncbi:hypothetical protein WDV93_13660 [Pantoea ananatis]